MLRAVLIFLVSFLYIVLPSQAKRPDIYAIAVEECNKGSHDCAKIQLIGKLNFYEDEVKQSPQLPDEDFTHEIDPVDKGEEELPEYPNGGLDEESENQPSNDSQIPRPINADENHAHNTDDVDNDGGEEIPNTIPIPNPEYPDIPPESDDLHANNTDDDGENKEELPEYPDGDEEKEEIPDTIPSPNPEYPVILPESDDIHSNNTDDDGEDKEELPEYPDDDEEKEEIPDAIPIPNLEYPVIHPESDDIHSNNTDDDGEDKEELPEYPDDKEIPNTIPIIPDQEYPDIHPGSDVHDLHHLLHTDDYDDGEDDHEIPDVTPIQVYDEGDFEVGSEEHEMNNEEEYQDNPGIHDESDNLYDYNNDVYKMPNTIRKHEENTRLGSDAIETSKTTRLAKIPETYVIRIDKCEEGTPICAKIQVLGQLESSSQLPDEDVNDGQDEAEDEDEYEQEEKEDPNEGSDEESDEIELSNDSHIPDHEVDDKEIPIDHDNNEIPNEIPNGIPMQKEYARLDDNKQYKPNNVNSKIDHPKRHFNNEPTWNRKITKMSKIEREKIPFIVKRILGNFERTSASKANHVYKMI